MKSRILMTLLGAAVGTAVLRALRKPHTTRSGHAAGSTPETHADTAAPMPDDGAYAADPSGGSDLNRPEADGAAGVPRH